MSNDSTSNLFPSLPYEMVVEIFTYLSGKELVLCRQVCKRWDSIVKSLSLNDILWQKYCQVEYPDIYKEVKLKSQPELEWFEIYKSLSLWPKLRSAREIRYEFVSACHLNEEIKNFTILRNSIMGVHKHNGIFYYNVQTMKEIKEKRIVGQYLRYTENDELVVALTYHLTLLIMKKVSDTPGSIVVRNFDNIKSFLVTGRSVYYVSLSDELCISQAEDDYQMRIITRVVDGVMTLGYGSVLNILTFRRQICSLIDDSLVEICCLDKVSNPFHKLRKYNFLDHFDWRIYFQWMYVLNHGIPEGLGLDDIVTVRSYGDIIFVGSNWGVLRIYHAPFSIGQIDLNHAVPMKQYNFLECYESPVRSVCPIIQVDVIEAISGHTVFVAMPKKIAVINYI